MSDFTFFGKALFNPLDKNDLLEKIEFGLHQQDTKKLSNFVKMNYNWKLSASRLSSLLKK